MRQSCAGGAAATIRFATPSAYFFCSSSNPAVNSKPDSAALMVCCCVSATSFAYGALIMCCLLGEVVNYDQFTKRTLGKSIPTGDETSVDAEQRLFLLGREPLVEPNRLLHRGRTRLVVEQARARV